VLVWVLVLGAGVDDDKVQTMDFRVLLRVMSVWVDLSMVIIVQVLDFQGI
jgi:hypothetical protein